MSLSSFHLLSFDVLRWWVLGVYCGAGALFGIGGSVTSIRKFCLLYTSLETSIDMAHGVIVSVIGSDDIGLDEVETAATMVQQAAHPDAHIIFGAFIDENMDDEIRVVVIATGFDNVPNLSLILI